MAEAQRLLWLVIDMKVYDMTHAHEVIVTHENICPPLLARMGTGGNQVPLVLGSAQANAAILDDGTCPTLTAQMGTGGNNMPLIVSEYGGGLPHVFKLRSGCDGGGKGYLGSDDKTFTLATNNDQYVMTQEPIPLNMQCIEGRLTFNERRGDGIGKPGEPANTLQAAHNHGVFDMQARVRKLTPKECERLQGFPDDYTRIPYRGKSEEECPDSPRYKAIGNSWAVPCVRWIGERIQKELNEHEQESEDNR